MTEHTSMLALGMLEARLHVSTVVKVLTKLLYAAAISPVIAIDLAVPRESRLRVTS